SSRRRHTRCLSDWSSDVCSSDLVRKVGGGHNCFLTSAPDCANIMTTWIKAWIGGRSSAAAGLVLMPPPDQGVGGGKLFPADSSRSEERRVGKEWRSRGVASVEEI